VSFFSSIQRKQLASLVQRAGPQGKFASHLAQRTEPERLKAAELDFEVSSFHGDISEPERRVIDRVRSYLKSQPLFNQEERLKRLVKASALPTSSSAQEPFEVPIQSPEGGPCLNRARGEIYQMTSKGELVALSRLTGKKHFSVKAAPPGNYHTPVVAPDGKTAFCTGSAMGFKTVAAVDVTTGKARWTVKLEDPYLPNDFRPLISPPAVSPSGDRLFLCDPDTNGLTVRDAKSGAQLWELRIDNASRRIHRNTPAVSPDGQRVAFTWCGAHSSTATLVVADAETGRELYTRYVGRPNVSSPVFSPDGETIYLSVDKELKALEASRGTERWSSEHGISSAPDPAISPDGEILAVSAFGQVALMDAATGGNLRKVDGLPRGRALPQFTADGQAVLVQHADGFSRIDREGSSAVRLGSSVRAQEERGFALSADGQSAYVNTGKSVRAVKLEEARKK
jgi:outer membrane protein assembly factor BamB